jgi:chromosome segregation ATPase
LVLQVEQLQNLLLIESGRTAEIQNSLDTKLSASAAQIIEQKEQQQQHLKSMEAQHQQHQEQMRRAEQENSSILQDLHRTREALNEAQRESAAASAIEQHVKSKLASVQQTAQQHKAQLEQQLATFMQERAEFERQLLQKDDSLKRAEAQVTELRQRCNALHRNTTSRIWLLLLDAKPPSPSFAGVSLSIRNTRKSRRRRRCRRAATSVRWWLLTNQGQAQQVRLRYNNFACLSWCMVYVCGRLRDSLSSGV